MSHHRKRRRHQQALQQPAKKHYHRLGWPEWLTWENIWRWLLPVRACFWGRHWFRWANAKFPTPDEKYSDAMPAVQTGLIVLLYFIAYGFYGSQQIVDWQTLFNNFLASFNPIALLNVAIFIIGLFVIYAIMLRVPWRQLWAPLACILLPLALAVAAFTFLLVKWVTVGDPVANEDILMRLAAFWVMFSSVAGFVYILYRGVKTRLNAYLMQPVLTPLIELTLAAKALDIALQGQATVLNLPYISSRLLVIALPSIMVIYYLDRTLAAHRKFLAQHNNTTTRQLNWCWRQIRNAGPIVGLWRTSGTATFRLGAAMTLLFIVTVFFPTTFSNANILDPAQIQHAITAGKSK